MCREMGLISMNNDLEKGISDVLLSFAPIFGVSAVHNYMDDKNATTKFEYTSKESTIKSHIRKGREKIPCEYFEDYLNAWNNMDTAPKGINIDEETWGQFKELLLPFLYEMVQLYDYFVNWSTEFPTLIFPKNDAIKSFSPTFTYRLNKNFNAFRTLNPNDCLLVIHLMRTNECNRQKILTALNNLERQSPNATLSALTAGEGQYWLKARRSYLSPYNNFDSQSNWDEFCKKVNNLLKIRNKNDIQKLKISNLELHCLNVFIGSIWPKDGETDTAFGVEEIDALIIFKYFLTEESQKSLLAELEKKH